MNQIPRLVGAAIAAVALTLLGPGPAMAGSGLLSATSKQSACEEHRQRAEQKAKESPSDPQQLIPVCDENGDYEATQCYGSKTTHGKRWCQCWAKVGTIVAGSSTNHRSCGCPIARWEAEQKRRQGVEGVVIPACERDGTFSGKRCDTAADRCRQAAPITGRPVDRT